MEFLREKVYTALNADELRVGDKVCVANNICDLRIDVKKNEAYTLMEVLDDMLDKRFRLDKGCEYALAYLVERKENCTNCAELGKAGGCCPLDDDDGKTTRCWLYEPKTEPRAEKKYRPFANTDELIKVWCEKGGKWQKRELTMPLIWVREKGCEKSADLITCYGSKGITVRGEGMYFDTLFTMFEFLDGSPCGVEE